MDGRKRRLLYFHLFTVLVWTGENNSNNLRVNAYVFSNHFSSNYPETCGGKVGVLYSRSVCHQTRVASSTSFVAVFKFGSS